MNNELTITGRRVHRHTFIVVVADADGNEGQSSYRHTDAYYTRQLDGMIEEAVRDLEWKKSIAHVDVLALIAELNK